MSDNYTFAKSMQPQSINDYSPYQDKQSNNYINDLNNGVYTNNGLTLVNFDLGAIYNSQKYTSTEDLTVAIPITMVAAYGSGTGVSANIPGANNVALCSMKSNFVNLIHQADLQINGKTIESTQPFINVARNFQMLSELDETDLHTIGSTLGFADHLDNYKSMRYTSSGGSGSGISNNRVFGNGTDHQHTYSINQNSTVVNSALQYKMGRYVDTSGNANGLGSVLSTTQMANEARPYFTRSTDVSGSYMIWYDVAVIKLSTIFESLGKIGLVKRFDATVRLWINTGTVGITVGNPNTATASYTMTASNNTFSNTCPLMINYFGTTDAIMATSTTTTVVAGLYIARPPTTSMMGINLALSGASHYLQNCRLYYPQITLQPEKSIQYSESNRNKNVVYRSIVSNLYTNIGVGGTFNALVNAGIVAPCAVLVCPFISASAAGFGDSAWKSPWDTAPALGHPVSLTNFNVSIGGSNVLQSTLNYSYEHFLQQVNLAEQMTSSDFGVSTGLISEDLWRWSKWYFCNVERSAIADKKQPRNVNVTFNNNSSLALDVLIFIFYTDELTIDVETGIVTK